MRKTTKLAGTKDMAKITQMDTSTSTEVVTLETDKIMQGGCDYSLTAVSHQGQMKRRWCHI